MVAGSHSRRPIATNGVTLPASTPGHPPGTSSERQPRHLAEEGKGIDGIDRAAAVDVAGAAAGRGRQRGHASQDQDRIDDVDVAVAVEVPGNNVRDQDVHLRRRKIGDSIGGEPGVPGSGVRPMMTASTTAAARVRRARRCDGLPRPPRRTSDEFGFGTPSGSTGEPPGGRMGASGPDFAGPGVLSRNQALFAQCRKSIGSETPLLARLVIPWMRRSCASVAYGPKGIAAPRPRLVLREIVPSSGTDSARSRCRRAARPSSTGSADPPQSHGSAANPRSPVAPPVVECYSNGEAHMALVIRPLRQHALQVCDLGVEVAPESCFA